MVYFNHEKSSISLSHKFTLFITWWSPTKISRKCRFSLLINEIHTTMLCSCSLYHDFSIFFFSISAKSPLDISPNSAPIMFFKYVLVISWGLTIYLLHNLLLQNHVVPQTKYSGFGFWFNPKPVFRDIFLIILDLLTWNNNLIFLTYSPFS